MSTPTPPTSSLPPLRRLNEYTGSQILGSLQALKELYLPPPPPCLPPALSVPIRKIFRRIHDDSVPDSGYASAEEDEPTLDKITSSTMDSDASSSRLEALEILRADTFEREFAIKWLTGFVCRSETWIEEVSEENSTEEAHIRMGAVDAAAGILSAFVNRDNEAECAVTRKFVFPSGEGEMAVHVELNDAPLDSGDHTSVGLQSWASSILLAQRMCATPGEFALSGSGSGKLRVLELGAGTGLLSIAVARLFQCEERIDSSTVVATDYHPDVLSNLAVNVQTNFPSSSSPPVAVHLLDWETPDYAAPLDECFDVILAADVIYHPEHAQWIRRCVERLLRRPSDDGTDAEGGVFWLMIPLRSTGRHEGMDHTVEDVFPDYPGVAHYGEVADYREVQCKGQGLGEWKLVALRREEVARQGGVGRADEGGYKLFKIGWANMVI